MNLDHDTTAEDFVDDDFSDSVVIDLQKLQIVQTCKLSTAQNNAIVDEIKIPAQIISRSHINKFL